MTNSERKRQRQIHILSTIDSLGFATRTHIQEIHALSSVRNANRVLRDMSQYLYHFRLEGEGERVYYLKQEGRDLIGSEKEMKKTLQIHHFLMRGDIYVYLNQPKEWKSEHEFEFGAKIKEGNGIVIKKITLRPDAECVIDDRKCYIEVDYARVMKENRKKIETYALLKDTYEKNNRPMFKLIFYTSSEVRQQKLKEWCKEANLHASVYTKKDIL